jgi:hypothetical protein
VGRKSDTCIEPCFDINLNTEQWRRAMILPLTCLAVLLISYGAHCLDLNTPIEHSLDGKHFTIAGSLQGSLFDLGVSRGEQLTLLRKDMTSQEQQALAELVRNDGVYKLRLSADPSRKDSPKLLTSIPAKTISSCMPPPAAILWG